MIDNRFGDYEPWVYREKKKKFRAWNKTISSMVSWVELLTMNLSNILSMPEHCGMELMQYIGLKDSDGAEVYEGDIVTRHLDYGGEKIVVIESIVIDYELDDSRFYVIGNIYENPEILEDGSDSD